MNNNTIFVFSSTGSNLPHDYKDQIFQSWNLNTFDSGCVIYNENFSYSNYFKRTLIRSGFKFPNFFFFNETFNIIDNYDYVCILDDDLLFKEPNSINKTINIMNKFDISLCSLSNNFEKKASPYHIMRSGNPDEPRIAITNFCEMGCMIFKKNLLDLCKMEYYDKYTQLSDWGFDWFVCSLAQQHNLNIGITRHLSFSNPIQSKRNFGYKDWNLYKDQITYIHPQEYRIIDVEY